MLRRLILVFMICVLPFQISWAMAGAYCEHESGKAAQHFGHHDHVHTAPTDSDSSDTKTQLKLDLDCSFHSHAAFQGVTTDGMSVSAVMNGAVQNATASFLNPQTIFDRPERPNWIATV
ncbi:MAG: hypothetical protein ACK4FF_11735 [Limnobacter sp.]|uniref:hypothetical protein n=1 Tax=Limnobacter sp. TaxID=2003368 RepID=UPI00391C8ACE